MKTTDKFLSAVVLTAAALCASCSTDDLAAQQQEQTETKTVSLTATLNENLTRAGMSKGTVDNTAKFYWHNKDALFVQTQTADGTSYSGTMFCTTDDTGETDATFCGDVASGATLGTYAVYPYNENHKFTGEKALTYNLPASYTYSTVDTGIFTKTDDNGTTYRTNSTNIPMFGTVANGTISFNYLGGLAVIRIDQMPVAEGTLTVTANEKLSGDFTVEDLSAADAKITTETATTDADKHVAFTFSGATKGGVGVFYLPLATGDYTHVRFEIKEKGSNTWWMYSCSGTLSIARAGGTAVSFSADDMGCTKKNADGTYTVNNHKFIDLGLSVLWAETNIGAEDCLDYGSDFAWGETATKSNYDWATYKHGTSQENLIKYNSSDNKTVLDKEDDAATVNWGEGVRMPTRAEMEELIGDCELMWGLRGDGVKYRVVTGKKEGYTSYTSNSIKLPAASLFNNDQACIYWSSEPFGDYAWGIIFLTTDDTNMSCTMASPRNWGLSVRAVAEKPIATE